jgi:hypothetical protein
MTNIKTLLAAATAAVAMMAGAAQAAPWDRHPMMDRPMIRYEHRPLVMRDRVFDTLRFHHYRAIGTPVFLHGHYVVRSFNRFGHVVFVEVNPYTGAFMGEFRA